MSASSSALTLVLGLLVAGILARRVGLMGPEHADGLNRFVTTACLPAIVLVVVPTLSFRRELLVLVAVPWLLLAVTAPAIRACAQRLGMSSDATSALLLCVPLGNTSFLGYPMIAALLGEPAVRLAVVYDQLGSFLMLAIWGAVVTSGALAPGKATRKGLVGSVARRAASFPPLIALAVAAIIGIRHGHLPSAIELLLHRTGDALVPVAMFAVGLQIELTLGRDEVAGALLGLAIKMGAMPLIAYGLARAMGAQGDVLRVVTLESAMPPMITAGALATSAGLRPRLAAALVGYGVLAASVVIPLWSLVH